MIDFTNKTLYQIRREALLLVGKKILINGKEVTVDAVTKSRRIYLSYTNFPVEYNKQGEVDLDKATRYKPMGFKLNITRNRKTVIKW